MRLRSCLKRYKQDTHRVVSPEETLARVEARMPAAGITRVADITNLDRIGIPVFSSIRPTAQGGAVSVYNGKGATPTEARVSAIMEGIERYSAEAGERKLLVSRFSEMKEASLDPRELNLPPAADPDAEIPWILGQDLMNDQEIYVPASAVFHPLSEGYHNLFRTNTNGLASGNEIEEAVFHGLAEVIERDAWSLVEITRNTGPTLVNRGDGLAGELLDRFSRAEVDVYVKDITSDVEVPTLAAISDDVRLKDQALLTTGMGTHTSAGVTLLRALTEVAQSRLTQIHGAREDTTMADFKRQVGYDRMKRLNKHWFATGEKRDFSEVRSFDSNDFLEDIRFMLRQLEAAGLRRAIVVNLTREEIGVPVVRVVVPGLEMFGVDPDRMGQRCRDARNRRVSRAKRSS
ncbi:MAG: YcaO-related McrA-glycine thioamidation protein [Methanosarcinales archaeon]|nr:YcaO-related McrA-glycine thioamidation protein [Methanosarcinales archaeon]